MTYLPPPEKQKIPEGHYHFRLNREPELQVIKLKNQDGTTRDGRKLLIYVTGINETGEFRHAESLVPWDERYAELLAALGVEHSKDVELVDRYFEADIVHEKDKVDPTKTWPRLRNILPSGAVSKEPKDADIDGDIPF
jgi:hypothetical protein